MNQPSAQTARRPTIEGLYELGHVLFILDAETNGFARSDIEGVECFWSLSEMHSSAAGFVMRLRDGRRAYVDFLHWHGFEQDEDFRIEVEFLADDLARPNFSPQQEPSGIWSSDTSHLNRTLTA